jgi:site-specific DNA recombinase
MKRGNDHSGSGDPRFFHDWKPCGKPGYGPRWLDDLVMDPNQTIELIAARKGKSERSIRMTLSLAFIAPPIVVAAIEGRLPRGFGAKRLMDLPMVWSHQWTALGLKVWLRSD